MSKKKILFVCAGNTCRSPMAQAIALKLLGDTTTIVQSAGIKTVSGMKATREALQVMQEKGSDLSNHRSQSTNEINVNDFDMIVAMTPSIADQLLTKYHVSSNRLKVFDIEDPYGQGLDAYRRCAAEIEQKLNELF